MPISSINKSVEECLAILDSDLIRKAPDTQINYHYLAKKFLTESGDFSRQGMLKWINSTALSDNSLRTAHYMLQRLCKALEVKFPLDKDDLMPLPDEDTLNTPTIEVDDTRQLIRFWRQYPKAYETSLVFISTTFGTRTCEMSATKGLVVTNHSIVVNVGKRKAHVVREHHIPEQYLPYLSGFENLSETVVRHRFKKCLRHAGLPVKDGMSWHSVRRRLATTYTDMGLPTALWKRFLRWAVDRHDMGSVYFHKSFYEVNDIMLGQIPLPDPDNPHLIQHPFLREWS